jgi:hypothetical protein
VPQDQRQCALTDRAKADENQSSREPRVFLFVHFVQWLSFFCREV